ncbi:BTB/POZ domain-containing protein 9-like isoform X2 [Bradysia coprophila]|uniref:BTB/POZ domain-containing protein 9-like isoform X2 n=1 Tax=Bradysia coprophila TaxID=38358 RepID=UPI00187DCE3F|nr:BTB/POZ domain-containing protein 9-like isoform X2 [Bradysia coprophila]
MSIQNNGELDCTSNFSDQIGELYLNQQASDVTFIINNDRIPAHKCILTARNAYFQSLFFGAFSDPIRNVFNLNESLETYQIIDNPMATFKNLLKFLYTGRLSLDKLWYTGVLELFRLADAFCVDDLKSFIPTYLANKLSLDNWCTTLRTASFFDLTLLKTAVLIFIFQNVVEVLHQADFKVISQTDLCFLLEHGAFWAPEVEMFESILGWYEYNQDADIETIISHIRFPTIGDRNIQATINQFSIENVDHLLDVIRKQATNKYLRRCVPMKPDINIASHEFNAKTISGDNPTRLLDERSENEYTSHLITGSDDHCIVVELGTLCIINQLKIRLSDHSYSYYVAVSLSQNDWVRVVDFTEFVCRSYQELYFEPRSVRYIKLVGTSNRSEVDRKFAEFRVLNLKAYYTPNQPALVNGFISPTRNVAKVERGAWVIEGFCDSTLDSPNVILNGTPNRILNRHYTDHSGYTCHKIVHRRGKYCCSVSSAFLHWISAFASVGRR